MYENNMLDDEKRKRINESKLKWRRKNLDKDKEIHRRSYEKNKEKQMKTAREKRKSSPEIRIKNNEYQKKWRIKNLEKVKESDKKISRRLRIKVLDLLGGKCIYCGCDILDALEVNHKNGRGTQEHKTKRGSSNQFYRLILNGEREHSDLELTCRICNAWHYLTQLKKVKGGSWKIEFIADQNT